MPLPFVPSCCRPWALSAATCVRVRWHAVTMNHGAAWAAATAPTVTRAWPDRTCPPLHTGGVSILRCEQRLRERQGRRHRNLLRFSKSSIPQVRYIPNARSEHPQTLAPAEYTEGTWYSAASEAVRCKCRCANKGRANDRDATNEIGSSSGDFPLLVPATRDRYSLPATALRGGELTPRAKYATISMPVSQRVNPHSPQATGSKTNG
jgi:hypothetical protein